MLAYIILSLLIKKPKDTIICGWKTALLQTSVVRWLVRFANVLFCALAVHFIVFIFLSLSSKLSAVSFFLGLLLTVEAITSGGLRGA
jgi:hypothetical protein